MKKSKNLTGTAWHVEYMYPVNGNKPSQCLYYIPVERYCTLLDKKCYGYNAGRCYSFVFAGDYSAQRVPLKKKRKKKRTSKSNKKKIPTQKAKNALVGNNKKKEIEEIQQFEKVSKQFPVGCQIRHKSFGIGTIKNYKPNKSVVIIFQDCGPKELSLLYCVKNNIIDRI